MDYWKELMHEKKKDSRFERPVGKIGYKKAIDAEAKSNQFGETLAIEYSNYLVPDDEDGYKAVVQNAYVHSRKKEKHVDPILKVIRKIRLPSVDEAERITSQDFSALSNKISDFYRKDKPENSLLLLIGNVGSGKSTFIRYLQNVTIPQHNDLKNRFYWCIINMNNAPITTEKIYTWVVDEYINKIISNFSDCDFNDRNFLDKIYYKEIDGFQKGIGSYLEGTNEYSIELFNLINKCKDDKELSLQCLLNYVEITHHVSFIFVLDNVDQGTNENQLLLFQVAEWFRNKFKRLVMMSLRDTTYNTYRVTPPLDTVIKNLVFRIDPPDLLTVLNERLKYICRMTKQETSFKGNYAIENGMKVVLKENDYLGYFKCIIHSVRQDNLIKSVFYNITGRDVRLGIELFIEFCKSGHLLASDFFAMRATDGQYVVPNYRMMEAVLRGTRLYYSSEKSKIKNVFSSDFADDWVDPFIRIDILTWLNDRKDTLGDSGTKGYFAVEKLKKNMSLLGHAQKPFIRELTALIRDRLILSGNIDDVTDSNNIIRITPFGTFHIC